MRFREPPGCKTRAVLGFCCPPRGTLGCMNMLTCWMCLCWHILKRVRHLRFQPLMPVIYILLSEAIGSVYVFCVFAEINNTDKASRMHGQWGVHWLHKILHILQQMQSSKYKTPLTGTAGRFVTPSEEPGVHKPVDGSPSSIRRFRFPLLQEYFQW